ncbi:MAG: PadR family transcriptional regulator, partial [Spirochaetia bacterium]|nr:PadR family transcriptional regulator [Spirochaetia bacterium]
MDTHIRKVYVPMTETGFYILLCLQQEMHGYSIVQKVESLTDGAVRLSPGTLYG